MSEAVPISDVEARKKVNMIFVGTYGLACLLFLVLALSGTTADPLGVDPNAGKYDWGAHGRALPPIEPDKIPRVFYPVGINDPLEWDTRPEGAPAPEELPPEVEAEGPVKLTEEAKRKLAEEQAAEAEAKELREQVDRILAEGDKLLARNRYPQAKARYVEAAKLTDAAKPEIAERFYDKGKEQERKRSWSRAQQLYRMALHFVFENAKYHDALATTSDTLGDKKKAAEHRRLANKFR